MQNILTVLANGEVVVSNTTNKKCYLGASNSAITVLKDNVVSNQTIVSQDIECSIPEAQQAFVVEVYDVADLETYFKDIREPILESPMYLSRAAAKVIRQINVVKALMYNDLSDPPDYIKCDALHVFFDQPMYSKDTQRKNLKRAVNDKIRSIQLQSSLSQKTISSRLYELLHTVFDVKSYTQLGDDVIDIAVNYIDTLNASAIENYELK